MIPYRARRLITRERRPSVRTRHRLWRARVVLLAISLLLTVLAPVAQAGSCPGGTVCLWTGTDFFGDMFVISPEGGCLGLSDFVSSGVNASDFFVTLYSDSGCGGFVADLAPGDALPAFSSAGSLTFG